MIYFVAETTLLHTVTCPVYVDQHFTAYMSIRTRLTYLSWHSCHIYWLDPAYWKCIKFASPQGPRQWDDNDFPIGVVVITHEWEWFARVLHYARFVLSRLLWACAHRILGSQSSHILDFFWISAFSILYLRIMWFLLFGIPWYVVIMYLLYPTTHSINVTMFCDIAACSPYVSRSFGATYDLHLQGRKSTGQETCV